MSMMQSTSISRAPRPSSLADVLDLILDKGLVIDAYVRVSVAGIELLTIDARIVVASVDTYLRFAEAVNRLDLSKTETPGLKALTGGGSDQEDEGSDSEDKSDSGDEDREARPDRQSSSRSRAGSSQRAQGSDRGSDDSDEEDQEPGIIGRLAERARFDR